MDKTISYKSIYSYTFGFENYFNSEANIQWMSRNWFTAFYWIVIYLVIIFGGQLIMKNREPYGLRRLLFLWNFFLALFAIIGAIRMFPETQDILSQQGFKASVCDNRVLNDIQVSSTWMWVFTLSKVVELVDTVFIVIRKQKLIFLHWYHHSTVLLFSWFAYSHMSSTGRWYAVINYSIHAFMYSYYTVRALNIRVPKVLALFITSSQIIQMIFGIFVALYAFNTKSNGYECMTPYSVLYWGLAMYLSYFVLFVNFFINSYLRVKQTKIKCDLKLE